MWRLNYLLRLWTPFSISVIFAAVVWKNLICEVVTRGANVLVVLAGVAIVLYAVAANLVVLMKDARMKEGSKVALIGDGEI